MIFKQEEDEGKAACGDFGGYGWGDVMLGLEFLPCSSFSFFALRINISVGDRGDFSGDIFFVLGF